VKLGDRAEEKTLRTRKRKGNERCQAENPPLATVNTHLAWRGKEVLEIKPGCSKDAVGTWEVVDERRW
jgi:hypothetical protein